MNNLCRIDAINRRQQDTGPDPEPSRIDVVRSKLDSLPEHEFYEIAMDTLTRGELIDALLTHALDRVERAVEE